MASFLTLPRDLTIGLKMVSLACNEPNPTYTTELPSPLPQRIASFLTLPSELRQQILKYTFENCITEDLATNLITMGINDAFPYIPNIERAKTRSRTPNIRKTLAALMKASPDTAADHIYSATNARKRYLELFKITMEIGEILKKEQGNTLTLGNLSRYIKTEGLLMSVDDIPMVKERFKLYH